MTPPKILYLGLAFPPGIADVFPEAQPAGHLIETCLIDSLRPYADIRSVGISWIRIENTPKTGSAIGLPHALNLVECKPELWHRLRSLSRLKQAYRQWTAADWKPDLIMVCNLSPVYNAFIRWITPQANRPRRLLYLADSVDLQRSPGWRRRLRHAFKPLKWQDADMARFYDACVAVSKSTEDFFHARKMPWLWLPNGCDAARAVRLGGYPPTDAVGFGYFGTLAMHGGVLSLIRLFKQESINAELHLCGWGKQKAEVASACAGDRRIQFLGTKSPDECVRFVRDCDVMVNPRPIVPGNENNFSSKVFEYALGGRAILTSRLSGVDEVLGPEAYYFDAGNFDQSLGENLRQISLTPRSELHRRGAAIQERLLTRFSWERQGERLRDFVYSLLGRSG